MQNEFDYHCTVGGNLCLSEQIEQNAIFAWLNRQELLMKLKFSDPHRALIHGLSYADPQLAFPLPSQFFFARPGYQ
jgi:hypothetical protein